MAEPTGSRFRILKPLGDGGMGAVYLAVMTGEGGFEKRVALKNLKPELSMDPESVELFMREAKLAAQLSHPNIVQVFDGGLDQGNLYLVLEYVDGGDLEGIIRMCRKRGRPISAAAVAHVGAQVCEGLCCLFELKDEAGKPQVQAHRDISPSNVLLSRSGVVKLSDFGVVRLRESKTAVGKVRGKWEYFPPELVRGNHDQRGDLFALGITLYKLAALVHPFQAPTPPQHFERACRDHPAPIPGLPAPLLGILARALTKDPNQRYQTAEEMGADLEAFITSCDAHISPRYLARELFGGGAALPTIPVTESSPTQQASAMDLFQEFDRAGAQSGSELRPSRSEEELRQFEDLFGPLPDRTPSSPRLSVPARERSGEGLIIRGPLTETQLRALYDEFAARYRAHRNQAPPVSFEQLALMVQNRRAQLQGKFPRHAVSASVVLQNDKVIVRLRPVDEPSQKSG